MEKEERIIVENLGNGLLTEEKLNDSESIDNISEEIPKELIVDKIFKDPEKIFDNGMDALEQENFEEAIKCFDEVIKLDSKYADAWFYKGEALEKQDEFEKAMKCFDEAIRVRKL